jgi:putative membrane protein
MTIRWLVAALHLLALGIGMAAILDRGWSLRGPLDPRGVARVFRADSLWGLAALLWISTGLARAFTGLEKGSGYYLNNHVFWLKMALLLIILALEVAPMVTFIRWRMQARKGVTIDTSRAPRFATISFVQATLVVLMVFAASAMARGIGLQ